MIPCNLHFFLYLVKVIIMNYSYFNFIFHLKIKYFHHLFIYKAISGVLKCEEHGSNNIL